MLGAGNSGKVGYEPWKDRRIGKTGRGFINHSMGCHFEA